VNYDPGTTYELFGSGFGVFPILYIGNRNVTTFLKNNDTYIQFQFPLFTRGGRHMIRLEVPGRGYASNSWWGYVTLNAWGLGPSTISAGGQVITVVGKGFDLSDTRFPIVTELLNPGANNGQDLVMAKLNCFRIYEKWGSLWMQCLTPRITDYNKNFKVRLSISDPITMTTQSP